MDINNINNDDKNSHLKFEFKINISGGAQPKLKYLQKTLAIQL